MVNNSNLNKRHCRLVVIILTIFLLIVSLDLFTKLFNPYHLYCSKSENKCNIVTHSKNIKSFRLSDIENSFCDRVCKRRGTYVTHFKIRTKSYKIEYIPNTSIDCFKTGSCKILKKQFDSYLYSDKNTLDLKSKPAFNDYIAFLVSIMILLSVLYIYRMKPFHNQNFSQSKDDKVLLFIYSFVAILLLIDLYMKSRS